MPAKEWAESVVNVPVNAGCVGGRVSVAIMLRFYRLIR